MLRNRCKELGIPDTIIIKRTTEGLKRYQREDGTHNHRTAGWCGIKEIKEEIEDAIALTAFEEILYGRSKRLKHIQQTLASAYKDIVNEFLYKRAKENMTNGE